MITEEMILLLANLDRAAAELNAGESIISYSTRS
jgi:hypothetical protein